jgi:RecA/RadA recombinase
MPDVIQSDLNAVNKLFGGWYRGSIINIFGAYLSGKTLLTLQEACYLTSRLGGDIALFDVDGSADVFVAEWQPVFEMRYGKIGKIHIVPSFNIKHPTQKYLKFDLKLFEHFGVKARVELSEGGKAAFIAYGICESTIDALYRAGVRVFIVDSFSQLHKDAFPSMSSFGERARAEDMLYSLVKMFTAEHPDVFFFLNHHVSINPMTASVDPSGGSAVIQNSKLAMMISKRPKEPIGKLYVYRHPRKPPWSESADIKFTDAGIFDAEG